MSKKPRSTRRPTRYSDYLTKEGLLKLEGWARDGLTNAQIAKNIGISEGTIYEWMKKYEDIDEALKKGKEVIDREVENALLKRALGYSYDEVKVETGDTGDKKTVTTKHITGDTTAQIFWLKNRKPREWRDKQVLEQDITANVKAEVNNNIDLSKLSVEELKQLEAIIDKTSDKETD